VNRIDRLHAILVHLQSKKVVTAREIAERFTISIRTVYRDIRALEETGVPIGAEAGYGYYLDSTYHLPPVMFTNEEAGSIVLAGKLLEKFSQKVMNKYFEDALYKIKAVLKSAGKEHLENLDSRVEILYSGRPVQEKKNLYLDKLQQSIAEKKKVKIQYHSQYNNAHSERVIEPIGLCYYSFS
jgi:predicted DNA-binding transcriptional regulator YafY